MAERKREETKVRCSLSEKTSWQRQWELDGAESLSDWLRTLANDRVSSAGELLRIERLLMTPEDVPPERRTETCPCGRPPFLFCGRCDA